LARFTSSNYLCIEVRAVLTRFQFKTSQAAIWGAYFFSP